MDNLEGMLMVPPERGQILGRAVWKMRYVVAGRRNVSSGSSNSSSQLHRMQSSRNNSFSAKTLARISTDECCLFVYKHKEDSEPIQQWPLNSISDCQVQMVAHRKQGPVLPTLVVSIVNKERKRRSSRAAGLISSSKESSSMTLWFRTPPEDHHPSLHEWARCILSKKSPLSPESPMSPTFTNPFASRNRDPPDYFTRPTSGNQTSRSDQRGLQHKSSSHTQSTGPRERPLTFSSESPSLRSKRSDVSTPSSANYPIQLMNFPIAGQHYTTVLPTDLPSPVGTTREYQGEFIEGWTSAQGRSSTMSSPIRTRSSISSQAPHPSIAATDSSSPGPRETILDRAFQMRCIPGSEQELPGEEKLSSLARFEALMREADDKRKKREAAERAEKMATRSAFEASDSSGDEQDTDSDDLDEDAYGGLSERRSPALIPSSTQRALHMIAGSPNNSQISNSPPLALTPKTKPSVRRDSSATLQQSPPIRPHTSHAKSRPDAAQRTNSTSQLSSGMSKLDISSSRKKGSEEGKSRSKSDKRLSTSSTKRLSFTEFTKRLSSTSSLLLVQTNNSGRNSRGSSESYVQPSTVTTMNTQGAETTLRHRDRNEHDDRCTWRNGVSMASHDGGFF